MARILVIDDDPEILSFSQAVLTAANHDVFTAENAMDGMDLLNSTYFDVVLSDANMPNYSGFDLIQTLRSNKRHEKVAIAMLTALREKKDIEKAIKVGVDDYIVKPLEAEVLINKVEDLLKKKPPETFLEINLGQSDNESKGKILLPLQIIKIAEHGLTVKSPTLVKAGRNLEFESELFKSFGAHMPQFKVLSCTLNEKMEHELRLAFVNATEGFLQKLRAWMYSQRSLNRTAMNGVATMRAAR